MKNTLNNLAKAVKNELKRISGATAGDMQHLKWLAALAKQLDVVAERSRNE